MFLHLSGPLHIQGLIAGAMAAMTIVRPLLLTDSYMVTSVVQFKKGICL